MRFDPVGGDRAGIISVLHDLTRPDHHLPGHDQGSASVSGHVQHAAPYGCSHASGAAERRRDLLVRQGRYGEILRVQLILERLGEDVDHPVKA